MKNGVLIFWLKSPIENAEPLAIFEGILGYSEELGDCIIRLGILAIGVGRFQDEIDTEVS